MATPLAVPPLAAVTFMPTSRDRATPLIAAVALLALAFVPWGSLARRPHCRGRLSRHASEVAGVRRGVGARTA